MKKIFTLIIFLALVLPLSAKKMTIAVLDFQPDGISVDRSRKITELIRTEIINTRKYIVIERKRMDAIFEEQGIQQTGCTDEECAVKMGKILSAQKILIGTIMQLGKATIINGRILDVEKGIAEYGAKQEVRSDEYLLNDITKFTRNIVQRITNIRNIPKNTPTVFTNRDVYSLYETVVVNFYNFPKKSKKAWVALVKIHEKFKNTDRWDWTIGKRKGKIKFKEGLDERGVYEVRVHLTRRGEVKLRYRFTVE